MSTGDDRPVGSLQPRLWLIGISLGLGIGVGLAMASQPPNPHSPLFRGPWLFLVSAVVQGFVGWALIRAGERPRGSLLADLLRERLRVWGAQDAPLKPLLWSLAFLLLVLAGMSATMGLSLAL